MVLFGGQVLRGFSLALLIGIIVGSYSSIAIASPIMVWWEQHLETANRASTTTTSRATPGGRRVLGTPSGQPLARGTAKRSRGAGRA